MMTKKERVALVTGAQRGLGFEACRSLGKRGYTVILASLFPDKGEAAAKKLRKEGSDVVHHRLDITKARDVAAIKGFVGKKYGRLDALVNCAGVLLDEDHDMLDADMETLRATVEVNTFGAIRMCQAFVPGMIERDYGRVVNVSSGRGQLGIDERFSTGPAYNLSKTALNAVTVMVADLAADANVLVNSVCPGWCRTEMGGSEAPRSPERGAQTIVWLATLKDGGPTGGFFRDKQPIPW